MIQFIGPALQGASFIGRVGVPLLQQAGIAAGMAGLGAGISSLTNRTNNSPTGRQKLTRAWGQIPPNLNANQGGGFGYATSNGRRGVQPSYRDAQGNSYDAVSGRLLYPNTRVGATGGGAPASGGASPLGGMSFGGSSAADRAYETEKSRVAQMTAQDPELQRYEMARAAAKTQDEMNAARDIGMEMWAKANPQLAAKVRAGQSGYDTIQGVLASQAANQGYGYQMPQQIMATPSLGMNVPQGLPAVQSMGATDTYGPKGLEVDPDMAAKFQALLNLKK